MKGVRFCDVSDGMMKEADTLYSAMRPRLNWHISKRVDNSRQNHWTLQFTRDNLAPVAARICLAGHAVDDIDTYGMPEGLLKLPIDQVFGVVCGDLLELEGCYLYYHKKKRKWVRSGKTSGEGKDACFRGRGGKHKKNAACRDQMQKLDFYRLFPVEGVDNLGGRDGYFRDLTMYCGLAFNRNANIKSLCSQNMQGSLFCLEQRGNEQIEKNR